jgi:hypothetical protein
LIFVRGCAAKPDPLARKAVTLVRRSSGVSAGAPNADLPVKQRPSSLRAKRRVRHIRAMAEAIQNRSRLKILDRFVAVAPRDDDVASSRVLAARSRPSHVDLHPQISRGRREGRVLAAPMARVQQKSTRQNHRYEPNNRPSLRDGFNAYTYSPRGSALLPPSLTMLVNGIANLAPAPRRQDHTISRPHRCRSSARECALQLRCGHRIPRPTFVTIAKRPSWKSTGRRQTSS